MNLKTLNLKEIKLVLLLLTFMLGRIFMGFQIGPLRLGEVLIGLSAIYLIFNVVQTFIIKKYNLLTFVILAIFIHFVFLILFYGYQNFDLYPFKASSYIWVLGFLYLGKNNDYDFSSKQSLILIFSVLLVNYYTSIFGISDYYQSIFLKFTDKFDYLKASDLLIFFIFFTFYLFKSDIYIKEKNIHIYLLFLSIFYLPLMMNKSRGASIAFMVFILFLLLKYKEYKFSKTIHLGTLFVCILLFILSTFIVSKSPIELDEVEERIIHVSTGRYEKPIQNTPQDFDDYPILYIENYRVYSSDGNLNWRFQIWQDVIQDMSAKNKVFYGYGYNEKIPAMEPEYRSGNDGTNENVHNFIINIFARGGLIHVVLFLTIFRIIYKISSKNNNLFLCFMILVPSIITSSFDASMENAHYPLIFYFLIGNLIKDKD